MQPSVSATLRPDVLFVDTEQAAAPWLPALRNQYEVNVTASASAAINLLNRTPHALVVTELDLPDGLGEEVCRYAKQLAAPPTVLVTTSLVERAPVALAAGCDGILLKPFAPNLLYARIARLLRARFVELQLRTQRELVKSAHLTERSALVAAGTNRLWPSTHCPYCAHVGVVSFDYSSHRRQWYACSACRKVWLAKRED